MRKNIFFLFSVAAIVLSCNNANAQSPILSGISGNFQLDAQYYLVDSAIGAPVVPEKVLSNGFGNLNFNYGNFTAGIRYESYLNPLLGFDPRYKGSGITYRFASFKVNDLEVTIGNFYDQIGSGLIFRSYEERSLGIDNALDGIRVKYNPHAGIYLKGFIGEQRSFFEKGPGIVRAFDADISLTEAIKSLNESKTRITVGTGVVSKYQKDENPIYVYPENVLSFAPRTRITRGPVSFYAEYAYKYNDPSLVNSTYENPQGIYKPGEAIYLNGNYSKKGIGVNVAAKHIDNMDFRSDRNATGTNLTLSYLPALTKQQTYRLITLYPYATQPNGEAGINTDVFYNIKKGTKLGGERGTDIALNYSTVHSIDKTPVASEQGYESSLFGVGDEEYFEEVNVEITKKASKKLKLILTYIYTEYNKDVIQGLSGFGTIYAHTAVADVQYKLNKSNTVRVEMQHLLTDQDMKSWAMMLVEYTISPHWFFAAFDEYNYGNDDKDARIHYPNLSAGYTKGANRISLGYGKQREGLLCVGGVCRNVPASNGFSVSVTSSF